MSENEAEDRKVLMSETLFRYLVGKAYPDDVVQIRFSNPPVHQYIEFWEPVVTVARREDASV